jgi:predicted Zn-dependent protease
MTTVTTVLGTTDTIVGYVNGSGPLNTANASAQLAAAGASLGIPIATPGQLAAIATANLGAATLAGAALAADIQAANGPNALGDAFSIIGDTINGAATVAAQNGTTGRAIATEMLAWGDSLTLLGLGITDGASVVNGAPIAASELQNEINEESANLQVTGTTATPFFVGVNGNAGTAWGTFETGLVTALTDLETAASATGSAFNTAATAASNALDSAETGLANLFNDTGATAENVTDTVTNNDAYTVTSSNNPSTSGTANINGSAFDTTATGDNSGFNISSNDGFGSSSVTNTTQSTNSSGTVLYTQTTTTPSSGAISATITGTGDDTGLSDASISFAANAAATVAGSADTIAAAAGVAVSLAAGSTGDTVTIGGSGDSVNISGAGADVGGDTVTVVGGQEKLGFTQTEAVYVDSGDQATITGVDGVLTANDNSTGNGAIGNTMDWNVGGSQFQSLSSLPSGVDEEESNYSGTNLTGTERDNIADYTSGISMDQILSGLPGGVTAEFNDYTGANDTGKYYQQNLNFSAGDSSVELFTPTNTISTEIYDYAGNNGTGTDTDNFIDWTAGGSQSQQFTGLSGGVSEQILNYAGANDTGTMLSGIDDYTAGNSMESIFANLPSGDSLEYLDYRGLNDTGALYQETTDYTNNTSQVALYNPTSEIAQEFYSYSQLNGTGTDTQNILNFVNNASQIDSLTGLPSGDSEAVWNYADANLTGTLLNGAVNYTAGTSTQVIYSGAGLPSSTTTDYRDFTGENLTGKESSALLDLTNGETANVAYTYNAQGAMEYYKETFYSGSTDLGYGLYEPSGGYVAGTGGGDFADDGGFGNDDGDGTGDGSGGYDGGYELAKTPKTGTNVGTIAQYDTTQVNAPLAAAAAEAAQLETTFVSQLQAGSDGVTSPFFEGAKWGSNVITWSLATSAGTTASPFSSYIGSQYEALVQEAFQEWAAASGLTFVQVADSSNSDIRIGWGDLNTASSGVVGYTSYQQQSGVLQPNVIVRLEDPSQNALVAGANNTLTYSGTQANLYQVIVHEIGHALGLADNADPNSVMYYQSGSNNGTPDSTDITGMQVLYSSTPPSLATQSTVPASLDAYEASINSLLLQAIQAAATFHTQQASAASYTPPEIVVAPTLAPTPVPH